MKDLQLIEQQMVKRVYIYIDSQFKKTTTKIHAGNIILNIDHTKSFKKTNQAVRFQKKNKNHDLN